MIPNRLGQNLGDDLSRVQRQNIALKATNVTGEPFGGAQNYLSAHWAAVGCHKTFGDRGGLGIFKNSNAFGFDGSGQALYQFCRLNTRDIAYHHCAQKIGDIYPCAGFLRTYIVDQGGGFSPRLAVRHFSFKADQLGGVGGDHQFIGCYDISVDLLKFGHPHYFTNGAAHMAYKVFDILDRAVFEIILMPPCKTTRQPATIAPRGTEACESTF